MATCPSAAAERYLTEQDGPEACPMCGKANAYDSGEPVFPEDWAFCSVGCRDVYMAEVRAQTDALVREMHEEDRYIQEFNAKCPRCAGRSEKLCAHQ